MWDRAEMLDRSRDGTASSTSDARGARLSRSLSGTNLARAGDYNQRTVLQAIRLSPGTTRGDIAVRMGLSIPAVSNITARLVDVGLVRVNGRKAGGRGQPALQLEIDPDGAFGVGLNIDRDHLTLVTLDLAGTVRSRVTREVAFALPNDVVAFFQEELDPALDRAGIDRRRVVGAGIALPDELGRIAMPHRPAGYDAWIDADIAALIGAHAPWPIHCDNDAAAAALGEAEYGAAFSKPTFFYLLISAGLGGGVVIDRSYHRGATARSGEIGLLADHSVDRPGALVQDTVSLSALLDRLEQAGRPVADVTRLGQLDAEGEAVVAEWLRDCSRSLEQPLTAINCLINPDAVLIGGRLPIALIERMADALNAQLKPLSLPAHAPIMPAVMAEDAAAIGAAMLPFLDHLLPSDATLITAGR